MKENVFIFVLEYSQTFLRTFQIKIKTYNNLDWKA